MTLIVAGVENGEVWIVGDTAITEGPIGYRDREFQPKIEISANGRAIGAFAGASEYGGSILRSAMSLNDAILAQELLAKKSADVKVDFLYAFINKDEEVSLVCFKNGNREKLIAAHIGSAEAFNTYQSIRLGSELPYAPDAFKQLMLGSQNDVPEGLFSAVGALIDLFATRPQKDVGGWATPFLLRRNGASFVAYAYAVSDPRFKEWAPGSIIPFGTAAEGGATLSVTELEGQRGTVIYWLQRPGGIVCLKTTDGYVMHRFAGEPTIFKKKVSEELGRSLDCGPTIGSA